MDLYHFRSHASLGSNGGEGSSSWGWTSPDGREFVAIGQSDGASFVEISKKGKMIYLGRLPQYSVPIIWREIRAYKNYMVIGSEAVGHNIQIFDMTKVCASRGSKDTSFRLKLTRLTFSSCSTLTLPTRSHSATKRILPVSSPACPSAALTMS